jgi:hypothetical protein
VLPGLAAFLGLELFRLVNGIVIGMSSSRPTAGRLLFKVHRKNIGAVPTAPRSSRAQARLREPVEVESGAGRQVMTLSRVPRAWSRPAAAAP